MALDECLKRDPVVYERYIRLLFEPMFKARRQNVMGLYGFVRSVPEGGNITSIASGVSIPSAQADAQRSFEAAPIVDAIGRQTADLIAGLGRELRDVRNAVAAGGGGGARIDGMFSQNVRQI